MFDEFGIVSFVPSCKVDDFVSGLKEGKIRGTKCKTCGEIYVPPRADCPKCVTGEMDWVDVNGDGELLTFTKIYFGPMGFEGITPYTLGIVDLEGGGRLLGMMEGLDDETIKLGMKVKIVPKVENERVVFSIVKG